MAIPHDKNKQLQDLAAQVTGSGNDSLVYQLRLQLAEKENRINELILANNELKLQNQEKEKRANEMMVTLKDLNHRLLLATKSANIGIWDWNLITDHLEWDAGMYQLYQIEPGEFGSLYDSWYNRVFPGDQQSVEEAMNRAISHHEKYETQFRFVTCEGQIRYMRASGLVEYDETGQAIRMIGINWDITAMVAASEERKLILEDMVQRNTTLEQFTYIISHNLRAPIANIIGATVILSEAEISENDRQDLIIGIHESGVQLDNTVKDLNQILAVSANVFDHNEMVDFAELVRDIRKTITDFADVEDLVLSYDFSAATGFFTLKSYLNSIFYNLISNSIKYRQKDVPCVISIKSEQIGNQLELTFTDNGSGINIQKHGEHIFGLYKRFHSGIDGKGMGLFMVKTQVEKLGGKITLTSIEKEQTQFRITFLR